MFIIKNSKIARFLKVQGIVLYPFIFLAEQSPSETIINHELIHVVQIQKLGVLKFYSLYLKEYLQLRLKGKNHYHAYHSISFEQEAYANQDKNPLA